MPTDNSVRTASPSPSCTLGVLNCVSKLGVLLKCAVVPALDLTAAEVQAAASTEQMPDGQVSYRCVLHAPTQDAVFQNAGQVVRMCEVLLRDAAAVREAATRLHGNRPTAAPVAQDPATACGAAAAALAAQDEMCVISLMGMISGLIFHKAPRVYTDAFPHCPSPLVLAALSAGPGSDLQRRLFSLLCTMVKLSSTTAGDMAIISTATVPTQAKECLVVVAAHAAAALLAGAAAVHQL